MRSVCARVQGCVGDATPADRGMLLFGMLFENAPNGQFKSGQVLLRNGLNGERVDVSEIVVHENIAKAADIPPRD